MKRSLTIIALVVSFAALGQGQLQKEVSGSIAYASGHVMQLANVVPNDKLSWAPQEGVRSFKDVFTHIISANYFFASKLGATVPADVNMQTVESDIKTKEDISKHLKQSYDLIIKAVQNAKDAELADKVEYPFPGEFTNMSTILIALSHTNEHLGQLIAYSRTNGITPPWSDGN